MEPADEAAFRALQEKLRDVWPTIAMRTLARANRTALIVPSIRSEVPASLIPVFPAYEERFLFFASLLLRQPGSTAIYLTSQPVLPRVIDYYFQLVPELNSPEIRQRLFLVSPVDGSPRPLTGKLLTRPRVIERIGRLIPAGEFRSAAGQAKYYAATDHLEAHEYASPTPDDLLDLIPGRGLTWQSGPQTGIAFHLLSALAVAGRVGLTAIGATPAQAEELFTRAKLVMDEESGRKPG